MLYRYVAQSMLSRKGNLMGALTAQVMAVTIIFAAMLVLLSTFDGPGVTHRLGAADLVIRVDPASELGVSADSVPIGMQIRVPRNLAGEVAAVSGVQSVVTDATFFAQVVDADGRPVSGPEVAVPRGQSWESAALTPFTLQEGHAPAAGHEIVIDRELAAEGGLAVGNEVMVASSDPPTRYQVTGIAAPDGAYALREQSSIFFHPEVATRLARGEESIDLIGVMLEPGRDAGAVRREIERLAGDGSNIEVLSGGSRGRADITAGADQLRELGQLIAVMSGFVGFVAIFVLAGTFSFSIQQRSREIGLQRAIGFTPRQVRRLIFVEAAVIASTGALAGAVTSWILAKAFVSAAIWQGRAPEGFDISFQPLAMVIVLAASFLIAVLAAWNAGRRASRIRAIDVLREAAAPKTWIGFGRLLFGLIFLIGGIAAIYVSTLVPAVVAILMSLLTATTVTIGAALLGALLIVPMLLVLAPAMRMSGDVTGELAMSNSRRFPARIASVVSPVFLALAFATLMFCFIETMRVATFQMSDERMTADLYVLPEVAGLPRSVVPLISELDGVETVDSQLPSRALFFYEESSVLELPTIGVNPETVGATMDLTFDSGGLDQFGPGAVLLSEFAAFEYPFDVGDSATFTMEDMTPVELTIAGVYSNSLGMADMVMAYDDLVPYVRDPLVSLVLVNVSAGNVPAAVAREIEMLGAEGYPLQVLTHDQYVSVVDQSVAEDSWATFLIIGAAALFGALSVINTLTMGTLERSREFALLRLIGASPRQVKMMLTKEAAIISSIGVLFGWGIGILSTLSVSYGLRGDTSALTVPILPVLGVGLLAITLVFASTLVPGMVALRKAPVVEIGSRE